MNTQQIKDRTGNLIGFVNEMFDGRKELRDRTGNLLGYYDPNLNQTRDRTGNLVAEGDALASLLLG